MTKPKKPPGWVGYDIDMENIVKDATTISIPIDSEGDDTEAIVSNFRAHIKKVLTFEESPRLNEYLNIQYLGNTVVISTIQTNSRVTNNHLETFLKAYATDYVRR